MNQLAGRIENDEIRGSAPGSRWAWLLGLSCLLLAAAVYVYQMLTPSDGARLDKGFEAWTGNGVIVHAFPGVGSLLQDGDLVVAIDGIEMEDWSEALFRPGFAWAKGNTDGTFTYRLIRNGESVEVDVRPLRHQLFDIDVIIRRTLVYGLLTAALVAIYFGSVVLLQQAFLAATGERSQAAIVFSTLAIAALFTPLRRRIQDFIDRRFFRKRYNAELILQAFSSTTLKEVDLDQLRNHLLQVVEETMRPEQAFLWIREPEAKRPDRYP
jgi:hypothetical protein